VSHCLICATYVVRSSNLCSLCELCAVKLCVIVCMWKCTPHGCVWSGIKVMLYSLLYVCFISPIWLKNCLEWYIICIYIYITHTKTNLCNEIKKTSHEHNISVCMICCRYDDSEHFELSTFMNHVPDHVCGQWFRLCDASCVSLFQTESLRT
jgi:hypothetical protein